MRRPPRARLGVAAALVVLPLAAVALRCGVSPSVPFIGSGADPAWLMAPRPVSAALEQWGRDAVPVTRYTATFALAGDPARARLRLRALRAFEARLNGVPVARSAADASWRRETRADLAAHLRPGPNELQVDVTNAHGPGLLAAAVDGLPAAEALAWRVDIDGAPQGAAVPADDTRAHPLSYAGKTPLESLGERRAALLALFFLGALAALALRRVAPNPIWALAAASLTWLAMFANTFAEIPLEVGFDARHHHAYVELLRSRGSLPLATDGWSTFHPPLFYLAALALTSLAPGSAVLVKLLPFLAGLATVWVVDALAGRLCPADPKVRIFAVLFAALLPMHVYSSAYFSNESFHTLLATLAVLAIVDVLQARGARTTRALWLGGVLGLAALTKFTALVVAAVGLGFIALQLVVVERVGSARAARVLVVAAGVFAVLAGGFYLRNWLHFGDPLMANWGDMPGAGHRWWQQPGFHTAAYFTGFGESLRHPYLSGFHSFWDSLYSTFWGDGFVAGRVSPLDRHPHWNYDFMSIGYLAALPASALVLWGAVRSLGVALGDADARRRSAFGFVLTTVWATLLAFVFLSLRLAFYSQAKATYLLVVIGPLAVFFGMGAARFDAVVTRWGPLPRALFHGWLALFAGVLALAFGSF